MLRDENAGLMAENFDLPLVRILDRGIDGLPHNSDEVKAVPVKGKDFRHCQAIGRRKQSELAKGGNNM